MSFNVKVISTLNDKNTHVFSMFCDLCVMRKLFLFSIFFTMSKQLMQTCINYNAYNACINAFLIFNKFSIRFKFWKAETWCLGGVAVMALACIVRDLGLITVETQTF